MNTRDADLPSLIQRPLREEVKRPLSFLTDLATETEGNLTKKIKQSEFRLERETLQIEFQLGQADKFENTKDCLSDIIRSSKKPQIYIAVDLGYTASEFSRRLSESENDKRTFALHDLDKTIESLGEEGHRVIYYLIEKFLLDHD